MGFPYNKEWFEDESCCDLVIESIKKQQCLEILGLGNCGLKGSTLERILEAVMTSPSAKTLRSI